MKKSIQVFIALQIAIFSTSAFSAGADFAGNGGGRPENNIRYAFHNMYKFIEDFSFHCQKTRCHLSSKEFQDLFKIKSKAFDLSFQPENLVYCYEGQSCPVSFNLEQGQPHRSMVAKDEKIYINLKHFYKDNLPAAELTETLSLLFHEIGHLAGITHPHTSSHDYLDYLGGKIRHYVLKSPFELKFPHINEEISVYYFEFLEAGLHTPDTLLNLGSEQIVLSSKIKNYVIKHEQENCPTGESSNYFINYTLNNLHWKISADVVGFIQDQKSTEVILSGNIEVSCNELSADYVNWMQVYKNQIFNFEIKIPVNFKSQKIQTLQKQISIR